MTDTASHAQLVPVLVLTVVFGGGSGHAHGREASADHRQLELPQTLKDAEAKRDQLHRYIHLYRVQDSRVANTVSLSGGSGVWGHPQKPVRAVARCVIVICQWQPRYTAECTAMKDVAIMVAMSSCIVVRTAVDDSAIANTVVSTVYSR